MSKKRLSNEPRVPPSPVFNIPLTFESDPALKAQAKIPRPGQRRGQYTHEPPAPIYLPIRKIDGKCVDSQCMDYIKMIDEASDEAIARNEFLTVINEGLTQGQSSVMLDAFADPVMVDRTCINITNSFIAAALLSFLVRRDNGANTEVNNEWQFAPVGIASDQSRWIVTSIAEIVDEVGLRRDELKEALAKLLKSGIVWEGTVDGCPDALALHVHMPNFNRALTAYVVETYIFNKCQAEDLERIAAGEEIPLPYILRGSRDVLAPLRKVLGVSGSLSFDF